MKRFWAMLLILCASLPACAQGIYGFEAGGGKVGDYGNYYTPAFGASWYKMVLHHVYLGTLIDWRSFSFTDNSLAGQYSDPQYGTILGINHHSTYLFPSLALNISIGENQYIHFNANFGPGFYLYGSQETTCQANSLPGTYGINRVNTSADNNRVIYQYGYGVSEYIPTRGYWSFKLSEQFCVPQRDLNSNDGVGPVFRSSYFCFTVGIARFYHKIFY